MDNTQVTNQQQNPSQENESAISLRDIVFIVLNNWYWFVISVILALVVTAFVYKSKPKAFTDNATILLRDDNNGKVGNRQNLRQYGIRQQLAVARKRNLYHQVDTAPDENCRPSGHG